MDPPSAEQRLSQITTRWTLLFAAHTNADRSGHPLLGLLVQRYCAPVYCYLLAAVRDPDVASDLAQEFALRFLRGDFHRAHPERGRFRSYLKMVLANLVADYHRSRNAAGRRLPPDISQPHDAHESCPHEIHEDKLFTESWRATLLERTWRALEAHNPSYHAALRLRVDDAEMTSSVMAVAIAKQLDRPMNAAGARKALERGHAKFADLLLDEVAVTLEDPQLDDIEAELRELDLLRYCKSAVERRRRPMRRNPREGEKA